MTRSPILATLVAVSFALQLLLAATGTTCVDAHHGAGHPASAAGDQAMAGMHMGMSMPVDMPTDERQAPCDQPVTPGACQLMGPCSVSFIAISAAELDRHVVEPSDAIGALALAPLSRTVAPELPPPRV